MSAAAERAASAALSFRVEEEEATLLLSTIRPVALGGYRYEFPRGSVRRGSRRDRDRRASPPPARSPACRARRQSASTPRRPASAAAARAPARRGGGDRRPPPRSPAAPARG